MSKTFDQLPEVLTLNGYEVFPVNQSAVTKKVTFNQVSALFSTLLAADFAPYIHTHPYEPANSNIQEHIASTSNPHNVTKTQLGLSNLTNDAQVKRSEMAQANGVATLDGGGKVPASQLPSTLMDYRGIWDATTNTPSLTNGVGNSGDVYRVSVAGSQFTPTVSFEVGDYCIYNGSTWEKSDTTDAVATVFGRTGNITAHENDYTWGQIDKTTSSIQDIASRSHTLLTDVGSNSHATIDLALTKLGTIQEGAEVNVNADWDATSGDAIILNKPILNQDAGVYTRPTFYNNGDGSCTIGGGVYDLYPTQDYTGQLKQYVLSGGTFTLTDNVMNYVVADYNNGSPTIRVITTLSSIDDSSIVPVYSVFRLGLNLHVIDWDNLAKGLPNKLNKRERVLRRFEIQSGLALSEATTRLILTTQGIVWLGGSSITVNSASSATDHTHLWYHSGGNWTYTPVTQYDNTSYDNGTNLTALTSNRYGVNWVFRGVYTDVNATNIVLGVGDYTLAQAISAPVPTLPDFISTTNVLVGRIIVQKSASVAIQIDQVQQVTLTQSSATNHDDLLGRDNSAQHPASSVTNTPYGSISATTVQAAINELDSEKQPLDATLTALSGVSTAADKLIYATGSDTFSTTTLTSAARSLLDDTNVATMRTTLGLGSIATQASNSVNITGGSVTGITDLAVADGGTGASDAATARANLGAAATSGKLSQFAATTSTELASVISDETGSGSLVFANSPTLVTPVLGVASATSMALTGGSLTVNTSSGTSNAVPVVSTSDSSSMSFYSFGSAATGEWTGRSGLYLSTSKNNSSFTIWQGSYPRLHVAHSTGNVIISSAPVDDNTNKLQVVGSTKIQSGSTGLLIGADASTTTLTDATTKGARLAMPHYNTTEEPVGLIYSYSNATDNVINIGGGTSGCNSATKLVFITAVNTTTTTGVEAARITPNQNFLVGTKSENTTTGNAKIQSSNGIYLGNTENSAANVLDWYEEGTFTPVVAGTTTAGTGTYTTQAGSYTRIGNQVFFKLKIEWTAHTGTGNMKIGSLPFTSASDSLMTSCSIISHNITFSGQLSAGVSPGTNYAYLYSMASGSTLNLVAIDTDGYIYLSGSYTV